MLSAAYQRDMANGEVEAAAPTAIASEARITRAVRFHVMALGRGFGQPRSDDCIAFAAIRAHKWKVTGSARSAKSRRWAETNLSLSATPRSADSLSQAEARSGVGFSRHVAVLLGVPDDGAATLLRRRLAPAPPFSPDLKYFLGQINLQESRQAFG